MKKQSSASLRNATITSAKRISTGIPGLDHVLGEDLRTKESGLFTPSSVVLCGIGGVGKTTLMLQMATKIKNNRFMYITTELLWTKLLHRVERLGWTDEQLNGSTVYEATTLTHVLSFIRDKKPEIVVVDEINELISGDSENPRDRHREMVSIVEKLTKESMAQNIAMILVCSTSKKEDVAAIQRVLHKVSTVMLLTPCPKLGKDVRILACPAKNRFGSTRAESAFVMTETGFVHNPELIKEPRADATTNAVTKAIASADETADTNKTSKQVVIRISSSLHGRLQLALKVKRSENPGQTITQSDIIRTILEKSL